MLQGLNYYNLSECYYYNLCSESTLNIKKNMTFDCYLKHIVPVIAMCLKCKYFVYLIILPIIRKCFMYLTVFSSRDPKGSCEILSSLGVCLCHLKTVTF